MHFIMIYWLFCNIYQQIRYVYAKAMDCTEISVKFTKIYTVTVLTYELIYKNSCQINRDEFV